MEQIMSGVRWPLYWAEELHWELARVGTGRSVRYWLTLIPEHNMCLLLRRKTVLVTFR